MAAGCPIICFEKEFNRARLGEKGYYMQNFGDLAGILENIETSEKIHYDMEELGEEKEAKKLFDIFQPLDKKMKSWSVKLGKGISAMKREGIWRGGKRSVVSFFKLFGRVGSGDILFISSGVGDSAKYRSREAGGRIEAARLQMLRHSAGQSAFAALCRSVQDFYFPKNNLFETGREDDRKNKSAKKRNHFRNG